MSAPISRDVAIIGMACLFPGAGNLDAYWQNIQNKVDAVTDPPGEAWDPDVYYQPGASDTDRVYCKRGGYLGSLASFDPLPFGIPPVAVKGGEPDQWLALQVARDALLDAGYPELDEPTRRKTEVILGKGTYLNAGNALVLQHSMIVGQTLDVIRRLHPEMPEDEVERLRRELKRTLPPMGPETVPGLIPNIIVGRIANRLDLMGPAYTIDAACASSLLAVQRAIADLSTGECDLALVGGAQVWVPVGTLNVFCQLGALSRNQRIRPFDEQADGTLLGEGIGMVVLKRLPDAERDGDRVYAVVKGVGVSSDGKGVSVMAPRVEGEILALRRAYEAAGVAPSSVGLIEAHGTGTPVGDVVEIQALSAVFGGRDGRLPTCAIGSVKSMISHTMPAAGAAGLIKAALALHHKVLPPTINCDRPNPRLGLEKTPFYINKENRPWVHGGKEPRRAGVNAFGFGGINAHVVLEEYTGAIRTPSVFPGAGPANAVRELAVHRAGWDSEVCVLEGQSAEELRSRAAELAAALDLALAGGSGEVNLKDVAFSLNTGLGRTAGALHLSVVAGSLADLKSKLQRAAERLEKPNCRSIRDVSGIYFALEPLAQAGKVAFLFPGEGAPYPNMLADVCAQFPEVRGWFDQMDRICADGPQGYLLTDYVFPRAAFSAEESRAAEVRLAEMGVAVNAVLTANQALLTLVRRLGIRPDVIAGHSTGEFSAIRCAGIVDPENEERLRDFVYELERNYDHIASQDGVPRGHALAVGANRVQVEAVAAEVGGELYVAMDNCPHQVVLVGSPAAVEAAAAVAQREGYVCQRLMIDRAYHTPAFAPYVGHLRDIFGRTEIRPPRVPIYSSTTSAPYPGDADAVRKLIVDHWVEPVEFSRTIQALYDAGVRIFVEVGPRGNLSSFVEDILRGKSFLAAPANVQHRSGLSQINHLAGMLTAHGVELDFAFLYEGRDCRRVDLTSAGAAGPAPNGRELVPISLGFPMLRLPEDAQRRVRDAIGAAKVTPAVRPPNPRREPDEPANTVRQGPVSDVPSAPRQVIVRDTPAAVGSAPQTSSPAAGADGSLSSYFATMHRFLEVQEEVVRAFRGSAGRARHAAAAPAQAAVDGARSEPAPSTAVPLSPSASAAQERAVGGGAPSNEPEVHLPASSTLGGSREQITERLLRLVSERTGYPPDMLDVQADLEADLGIDSIKRVEILGSFRQQFGDVPGVELEQLTTLRTLRQIVEALAPRDGVPVVTAGPRMTSREQLTGRLLQLVSERTGYPPDMLDVQADLEADLGIDSIKRVEILGSFRQQFGDVPGVELEQLTTLRTLRQIVDALAAGSGEPAGGAPSGSNRQPVSRPHASSGAWPLLGDVLISRPGQELVAERSFSTDEDLYLRDHTLGRDISATDPGLLPLAVMPLTMSLEVLAEAAAALEPGRLVVGLRHVRAHRWLIWQDQPQRLRVTATATAVPGEVHVQLRNVTADEAEPEPPKSPAIEATVVLAAAYPPGPRPQPLEIGEARPSRWTAAEVYSGGMFHGPAWQGVVAVDRTGTNGCAATLRTLPFDGFLRSQPRPQFSFDPVALDAAGQLVGFWTMEHLDTGMVVFPFAVEAIDFFGPPPPAGEQVRCEAEIRLVGDAGVTSTLNLWAPDGASWVSIRGWQDKRFYLPEAFHPLLKAGLAGRVSQPWPPAAAEQTGDRRIVCRRAPAVFPSDQAFWTAVWGQRILSRRERDHFRQQPSPPHRLAERIAARAAAKEAICDLLRERRGLDVRPADIDILPDEHGRPVVSGAWQQSALEAPVVSLAHTRGWGAALVGLPAGDVLRLGIDLELLQARDESFAALAFAEDELALFQRLDDSSRQHWLLRAWCAKEATGKALGLGLVEGPRSVAVVELDMDAGTVLVRPQGRLSRHVPEVSSLAVLTAVDGDVVMAAAISVAGTPPELASGAKLLVSKP